MIINNTPTKINILHFNDSHGSNKNIDSFLNAQDKFYKNEPKTPTFTLCAGDLFVDKNKSNESIAKKLASKVHAFLFGNHDLEGGVNTTWLIQKYNMAKKWVSCNISFNPCKKAQEMETAINKSIIIEDKGEKMGVIGVSPFDFRQLAFLNDECDFISIKNLEETKKIVAQEVKKLEEQGVNKIILLAHTGYSKDGINLYSSLAQIGGIDVILGEHDHLEISEWCTSERGEPVKIASCGRSKTHEFNENLDYIGKMNLVFDENGVLIKDKCKNTFECIEQECKNEQSETIYEFERPFIKSSTVHGHSEIGNVVADSNLWYVNQNTKGESADFAFVNAGTIRGNFNEKEATLANIKEIVPFTTSTLIKAPLSKKQIIDTLTWCTKSTTFQKISPGCMQVSGMEYTICNDLSIKDVHILNKDGSIKYNLDDFDDDDEFMAVYDVFLATGPAGLTELIKDAKNDNNIEFFDASRQDALEAYLRNNRNLDDWSQIRIKKENN